jgi:GTP-binding protein
MVHSSQDDAQEGVDGAFARKLFAGPCAFVCAASEPAHFAVPEPPLPEVALIGRSNVGKSSLINALVGRKNLARASKTPGRTQQILFFDLGQSLRLVDLPGYGFAKAPPAVLDQWNGLMRCYLRKRAALRLVCLLIDSRHGVKASDLAMMRQLDEAAVPYQLVLTKTDLVRSADVKARAGELTELLRLRPAGRPQVLSVSADKGLGVELLRVLFAAMAVH